MEVRVECIGGPKDGSFSGWPPEGYRDVCLTKVNCELERLENVVVFVHESLHDRTAAEILTGRPD